MVRVWVLGIFKPRLVQIYQAKNSRWSNAVLGVSGNIILDGKKHSQLEFNSNKKVRLRIPGKIERTFQGNIKIVPCNNKLMIINTLLLKNYLTSVTASEIGSHAPAEALKVQAILSRTRILKHIKELKIKNHLYDVKDLTGVQVYKGYSALHQKAEAAVKNTQGKVLTYEKKLAMIFYASTCGGGTALPHEVWKSFYPYYSSVPCSFKGEDLDAKSPHYKKWQWKTSLKKISALLNIPGILDIQIFQKDSFGRAILLEIITPYKKELINAEAFRIKIGRALKFWGALKSSLFIIQKKTDHLIFIGRGLGHGVGLCQWGAKSLAKKGWSYKKILKFYYPKLELSYKGNLK